MSVIFSCGHRNGLEIECEMGGQFLNALAAPVLGWCSEAEALVHMLVIGCQKQSSQFAAHIACSSKGPLQQEGLEPTVEVFHRAIALWADFGDEDRFHTQA